MTNRFSSSVRSTHGTSSRTPAARRALQLGELRAIVRLAPRLDGILLDRLRRIRHDQLHVELDDVAEAVTDRTGAERVVEREQARLRHLVRNVARAAFEPLAEPVHDRPRRPRRAAARWRTPRRRPRGTPSRSSRSAARAGRPRPSGDRRSPAGSADPSASPDRRPRATRSGRRQTAGRSPCAGARRASRRPDRRRSGQRRAAATAISSAPSAVAGSSSSTSGVGRQRRRRDHRHVEADEEPRALRKLAEPARHHFGGLANHLAAAVPAIRPADARIQQPQVVVDLGGRADRRPRIADAVLLADRDRRADALDRVDVRLLHPLEELPGVGRQRFDVAPLPFGVDRVEGERRLPRAAHARHDDERAGAASSDRRSSGCGSGRRERRSGPGVSEVVGIFPTVGSFGNS